MNMGGSLFAVNRVLRVSFVIVIASACFTAGAQVNSWINPTSGNWDDTSSWSLGVLPNSSQPVMITNSGFKAVAINPSTPVNFPGSMTVSSLTIQGPTNSDNLLLLNYFGTDVPLTVLNGLTLQDDAQIENLNSGLVVQGGTITVTNSQINQDGGFINTMGAHMNLSDSAYNLTNGDFEGGAVSIGYPASAQFNQYGGTAIITNLGLASYIAGPIENGIFLYGGILELPNGMNLTGEAGGVGYFQTGGTNLTAQVFIEPDYGGFISGFNVTGGLLADSSVQLFAGYEASVNIYQSGGSHVITNTLFLYGSSHNGYSSDPATYNLNGGTLSVGTIELDADDGDTVFVQSNATTSAGTVYAHSVGYYGIHNTTITLEGGTLSCSYYTNVDGGGTLNQSGGALVVSNLLNFGGYRDVGAPNLIYATYTFTGGTLTANDIYIGGTWIIGDGSMNRISNPGTFSLSHLLAIGNAVEQLGQFILAGTNATIDLAGSASQLSFANSSGQTWNGGGTLFITNWNGSPSGGGGEYLKFGTDQSGLTVAQLNQIQFQIGTNTYPAKILATGEVVPNEGSSGGGLVNSWTNPASGNWDQATNWSLGILPDSSQSIMITNSGFKAVAIQPSTPINFPGSMTVSNLTISAPSNSFNELLMNFVEAGNPLIIGSTNTPGSLVVGSNASIVMLSSGLGVNDALGASNSLLGNFEVDGTFTQSDGSEVVAGFLDLTGTYNFTNGMLFVGTQFINGTFNQQGGRNLGSVDMETTNGNYELFDGNMQGSVTLRAGTFNQWSGTNTAALVTGYRGVYNLAGGVFSNGDIVVGSPPQNFSQFAGGGIEQSGGTNISGNITMVFGFYDLSNGTLMASSLTLTTNTLLGAVYAGEFDQYGGYHTNGGTTLIGGANPFPMDAFYFLYGGTLETPSINMNLGIFELRDATNRVTSLSIMNHSIYEMDSGLLAVDKIQVIEASTGNSEFWHLGGTLTGARNITLANGQWIELGSGAQFGQLQLSSGTNSALTFQTTSNSCVLSFADSSGVSWASDGLLAIQGWRGATNGGGTNQVLFGTSASGLTAQQLSQVLFSNPAGLPSGTYSARILSDGEVVPNFVISASIAFSTQGNNLVLTWPAGWTLQSTTNILGPYTDVPSATSPYTNHETVQPQQFFRLRQ